MSRARVIVQCRRWLAGLDADARRDILRYCAISECRALMLEHAIEPHEIAPAPPTPRRTPPPKAAVRPAPAPAVAKAPPPAPAPARRAPIADAVIPADVKVTRAATRAFDPRYQVDPTTRPHGAGFAAAGIGRYLDSSSNPESP
jgi:hypothetical protein